MKTIINDKEQPNDNIRKLYLDVINHGELALACLVDIAKDYNEPPEARAEAAGILLTHSIETARLITQANN